MRNVGAADLYMAHFLGAGGASRFLPVHIGPVVRGQQGAQGRELEFIVRSLVELKLQVEEEKIRGDQWADKPGILPAYNAYSPSGDVTGEIVYVNFGIPADYETL